MSPDEIAAYNAAWLKAWTDKDTARLAAFYAEDCVYKDPRAAAGLNGRAALTAYLQQIFDGTPPTTYTADEVWPIPGGFCGRWYAQIEGGPRLRGFDLVLLKDGRITLNEVYLHTL